MIDFINNLPARIKALLKTCLANLTRLLSSVFTDIVTEALGTGGDGIGAAILAAKDVVDQSNIVYNGVQNVINNGSAIVKEVKSIDLNINFDENFVSNFNQNAPNIPDIYKQIGYIINPLDLYFKTFMSNVTQPSIINDGLMNNGINPSFQYIFLNSTITSILYPSLRTIKASLITSPYNQYPTLNDIQDIQCDLNSDTDHFIIRIYTRPYFSSIDNSLTMDNFYGNYFDSSISGTFDYTTFHLNDLFSNWTNILNTYQPRTVYYNNGPTIISTYGEEEVLAICIYTNVANANIGIKNIIVSYK
jgi:hypothetical protein